MAGPTIEIEPPVRKPRTGGLSTAADFRPNDRLGVAGGLVFQSGGCVFPNTEELRCYADPAPADKTTSGIDILDGIGAPFTVFAAVQCTLGPDPDELARARAVHEQGLDRVLEGQLQSWAAGGVALVAGADLTDSIALVENALDGQYLGQGVILMARADAVRADAEGSLHLDGDRIVTINGTPVVASASFPQGTVYGVGAVVVEHTPQVELHEVSDLPENRHFALAEGVYALAVDCEFRVKSTLTA